MFNFRFEPSQTLEISLVDVLLLGNGVDLPLLLGVGLLQIIFIDDALDCSFSPDSLYRLL